MDEADYPVVEMMEKYGGSFVQVLGALCRRADPINMQKIKDTWPEYWKQYFDMAVKRHEKEN